MTRISIPAKVTESAFSILFGDLQIERGCLARDFAALQRMRLLRTLLTPPRFFYVAMLPKVCEACTRLWCREVGSGKRLCPACAAQVTPLVVPECLGLFSAMRPRTRGGYGL